MGQLRNRGVAVSVSRSQRVHLSDGTKLILYGKSFVTILRSLLNGLTEPLTYFYLLSVQQQALQIVIINNNFKKTFPEPSQNPLQLKNFEYFQITLAVLA